MSLARPLTRLVGFAFVWAGATALAGNVVIVNGDGTVFPDIQSAVNAASEGDVLIVGAGNLAGDVTIDGKSLVLMPGPGATVIDFYSTFTVKNLAANQSVSISDLVVHASNFTYGSTFAVSITDDAGAVLFQGCSLSSGGSPGGSQIAPPANPTVRVVNSSRVSFTSCTLNGGTGGGGCGFNAPFIGGAGGAALATSSSRVTLQGCQLHGGAGGRGTSDCGMGGAGAHVDGGFLFATSTLFAGADGAPACSNTQAGDGGNGIESAGDVHLSGCTLVGGAGGESLTLPLYGNPGSPSTGPVTTHPVVERAMSGPRFAQSATAVTVAIHGSPGDNVYLTSSTGAELGWKPANNGVWLVPAPRYFSIDPNGIVPASGVLSLAAALPELPFGTNVGVATVQALVIAADASQTVTYPVHVMLLRASAPPDCNANQRNEYLELLTGAVTDCNANLVPDTCESQAGMHADCNANGVPDYCDILHGTSVDLDQDTVPDECESHTTRYVDAAASAGGDGSQAHPFRDISTGFAASANYDTLIVADGVYTGASNRELNPQGHVIRVLSVHGPATCTIDCQSAGRAFDFDGPSAPGSSLIAGFNIIDGAATKGGGIYVSHASVRVANCIVRDCVAQLGGGIYLGSTSSIVKFCTLSGNVATGAASTAMAGGAILVIQDSFAATSGPAIVTHCKFFGNRATDANEGGGAIGHTSTAPLGPTVPALDVDDCLFAGNSCGAWGGGVGSAYFNGAHGSVLAITDSTFVGNRAAYGGAVASFSDATATIANCILWQNAAPNGHELAIAPANGSATVSYCDVQGGLAQAWIGETSGNFHWGSGNFDLPPRFVDADGPDNVMSTWEDNDYRLSLSSPCIDAGDNDAVPADLSDIDDDGNTSEIVPQDLDLHARFHDTSSVPDTGHGTPPIIDVGCYENQNG